MKRTTIALMLSLFFAPLLHARPAFSIRDTGDFFPVGHRVEFADRYGWRSYTVDFDFGLDGRRKLSKDSKLTLTVLKRDGDTWEYTCRVKRRGGIYANINYLHGKGISIVAQCRIDEEEFADAVGMHKDDVGIPNLVFHVLVKNGKVSAGAQRGLYFIPNGDFGTSELNTYASVDHDPSNLSVPFRSRKTL